MKETKPEDLRKDSGTVTHSDGRFLLSMEPENHSDGAVEPPLRQTAAAASTAQCRLNLLDHVESLHHQIGAMMDLIERELDGNAEPGTRQNQAPFLL